MKEEILAYQQLNSCVIAHGEPVGIRFLSTREDYLQSTARETIHPISYCCMVHAATRGHAIKCHSELFGCRGSKAALGMIPTPEEVLSGQNYFKLGLYKDIDTCKNMVENASRCEELAYGVEAWPLLSLLQQGKVPQVVLMCTDAYGAMRALQGYSYQYGGDYRMFACGNQAVCAECTARPLHTGEPNVSFFCGGTRYRAGWKSDELMMGIPWEKFCGFAQGVLDTVNIIEPNERKQIIQQRLAQYNIPYEMRFDFNYYRKGKKQ